MLAAVAAAAAMHPTAQARSYHSFADQRSLWGVPNCANVLSSLPIGAPGLAGLWLLSRHGAARGGARSRAPAAAASTPAAAELAAWAAACLGTLLIAAGSVYYHLAPSTPTLVFDRLGIAITFSGLLSAVVAERRGPAAGGAVLGVLLLAGPASVAWWHASEAAGSGDLRWYLLVQLTAGERRASGMPDRAGAPPQRRPAAAGRWGGGLPPEQAPAPPRRCRLPQLPTLAAASAATRAPQSSAACTTC